MTPRSVTLIVSTSAFFVGCGVWLLSDAIGSWLVFLTMALIAGALIWIVAKTRFSTQNYTPKVWRVQFAAIAMLLGYNLTKLFGGV